MKKFIIVILLLAVCGALVYFGYPEISKLINGEQTVTSSETDTASDISSADNHEIGIEELKSEIDGLEAGATIKINDEKSSLKAFNAVKDYLDEKKIAYSVSDR